jgi:hypothetical protein
MGIVSVARQLFKKLWYSVFSERPYTYVGRFFVKLVPKSYHACVRNEFFTARGPAGVLADIIRAEMNRRQYASNCEEEIRKRSREEFWGETPGKRWHEFVKEKFSEPGAYSQEFLGYRKPLVRLISELLTSTDQFHTMCEIGTGNGMFLRYLSEQFPEIRRFVGVDLNRDQIRENQETYKGQKLKFDHGEITEWVQKQCEDGTIFAGNETFDFFTQREFEELLQCIQDRVKPAAIAIFALVESGSLGKGVSKPRGSLAFSHDYPYLLTRCRYQIFGLEIQRGFPYDQVSVLAVASSGGG